MAKTWATLNQLRGMMLEVALILDAAGYTTVSQPGDDPTLDLKNKGLEVRGRSGLHQIDRVANFFLKPPFSHPYRLLVEVKYHQNWQQWKKAKAVGIGVIRNAVGVLKDVSEFWTIVPPKKKTSTLAWEQAIPKSRYHYQYAVITSTRFAGPAQAYAFAHDVYLIPMARSRYFRPILHAIDALAETMHGHVSAKNDSSMSLSTLRQMLADRIPPFSTQMTDTDEDLRRAGIPEPALQSFKTFCQVCQRLKFVVIATLDEQFPLVLAPDPDRINVLLNELRASENDGRPRVVELHRDPETQGWLLTYHDESLFSFDLPANLLKLYIEQGIVGFANEDVQTLDLQATLVNLGEHINGFDNRVYTVKFSLSREVFNELRAELDKEPQVEEDEGENDEENE